MTAVTISTLRRDTWLNFYTFLSGLSLNGTPTIKQSWDDRDTAYPIIVFPSPKYTLSSPDLDGTLTNREGTISLEVHSKDALQLDRIMDGIDAGIRSNRTTLEADGMQLADDYWRESDEGIYLANGQKIHMKAVTIFFESLIND